MSDRMDALAQLITGKSSIEECSAEEARHLSQRHPFFAPAQFIYLQKLKQTRSADWQPQQEKSILFYHDPLLFNYFIEGNGLHSETFPAQAKEQIGDVTGTHTIPEKDELDLETHLVSEPMTNGFDEISSGPVGDVEEPAAIIEEPIIDQSSEEPISEIVLLPEALEVSPPFFTDTSAKSTPPESNTIKKPEATSPEINQLTPPVVGDTAAQELTFEPFHTVDYFASQGIKVILEEAPKDKLGKQLKSFTQWLKTMKRLPSAQPDVVDTTAEKKIETMATHSVSQSDVVTEAMAEVWLKQGNIEKAVAIYNKLSLLEPSKTAYFAAKIQNLKSS